jgi:hypothetical protein
MSKKTMGNLMLLAAAMIWGAAFVAQTVGMDYVGPFTFQAVRYLLGGMILLPVIAVMDKNLHAADLLQAKRAGNSALDRAFDRYSEPARSDLLKFNLNLRTNAESGRRAELLKNPDYRAILEKYR